MRFAIKFFDVSEELVKGSSRKREHTIPRFWICAKAANETKMSLKAIGRAVGGRDHSTVIHAQKVYNAETQQRGFGQHREAFLRADEFWELEKFGFENVSM